MNTLVPITNDDSSKKLNAEAKAALLKNVSSKWAELKKQVKIADAAQLVGMNLMREIGTFLQEASGHEQLSLTFFEGCKKSLPKDFDFRRAKACVSIAKTFPEPIKDLAQAKAAQRQYFLKMEMSDQPQHRLPHQTEHFSNPWSELVSTFSTVTSIFEGITKEKPMQNWGTEELKTFIRETGPIAEKHKAALILLEEKA